MEKLINYISDYDNIELPVSLDEIEYIMNHSYNINDCDDNDTLTHHLPKHNYIARIRNGETSYIELPSNIKIKKFVTTNSTSGFISTNNEFYILYDNIQYFEKIANHIKDCICGTSVFLLITEKNTPLFINAADGNITDDTFWDTDSIKDIYTIKNKFIIKTHHNSLYMYDGCVTCGFSIDELENNVQNVVVTLDTVNVLTIDGRVWVFGNKEHGAYITDGRGFIPEICNAIQVVRTIRAGAILTRDNKVWSWGDVRFGGSPRPTWVGGLDNCEKLLNTATSIIAITLSGQLWAWSNEWFKNYSMIDSDYAVASCIRKEFTLNNIVQLSENKLSWIIRTRCNNIFYIGKSIKQYTDLESFQIHKNNYIWLLFNDCDKNLILLNDDYLKPYSNVSGIFSNANTIVIECLRGGVKTQVHTIILNPAGQIEQSLRLMKGNIKNVSLTKYGNICVSTFDQIYTNSRKVDHSFTNISCVLCNEVEMFVLLYIPPNNTHGISTSTTSSLLLTPTLTLKKSPLLDKSKPKYPSVPTKTIRNSTHTPTPYSPRKTVSIPKPIYPSKTISILKPPHPRKTVSIPKPTLQPHPRKTLTPTSSSHKTITSIIKPTLPLPHKTVHKSTTPTLSSFTTNITTPIKNVTSQIKDVMIQIEPMLERALNMQTSSKQDKYVVIFTIITILIAIAILYFIFRKDI